MTVFAEGSYWNAPLPLGVPRDKDSARFISWLKSKNKNPYLALASGDWAMPVYRATADDPFVRIDPSGLGPTVTFHLPAEAEAMTGNDAAMLVLDPATNQDIALFEFNRVNGKPVATGVARYWLDSEGLDQKVGGTAGNQGHRGLPGSISCVKVDDQLGLTHRLKFAIPGTGEWGCFPMSGFEKNKGGIIGEGIVMRVKPSVRLDERPLSAFARVVAQGLQTYGAVVGDNGGVAALKVERGLAIPRDALKSLTWDDFEFVQRGWRP